MDWFERLTGFAEGSYDATKALLRPEGEHLHIDRTSRVYKSGRLELPSLLELRSRLEGVRCDGGLEFLRIKGDVGALHRASQNGGAMFQVASQFNLLEMVGPDVTPEDGVTRYQWDATQGPVCAIAAGAATLYRNYLVPVAGQQGQTAGNQVDTLADVRDALAGQIGRSPAELWSMSNGYTLGEADGLHEAGEWLRAATPSERDAIRSKLRIGVHWDVEVTDNPEVKGTLVSQAFCSAIPVSYSRIRPDIWEPLARLVLEAAYEATFAAAAINQDRGISNTLYLTRLGGGAFGNPGEWIDAAIERAQDLFGNRDLKVALVEYGRG